MLEFAIIISLLYVITILSLTIGWFSIKRWHHDEANPVTTITIIIPVRDEEESIGELLHSIATQSYPKDLFDVVVVDDHSSDRTVEIANRCQIPDTRCQIKVFKNFGEGKKDAIRTGIMKSNGILIITTDGDCKVGPDWLLSIASFYEKYKPKLISGPVVMEKTYGLFKSFQSMEFMSLVASGAGSIGVKMPIMCNGANLAFEKEAYKQASDNKDLKFASGDDIFLLLKMKKHFGSSSIRFIKSNDAIVQTHSKKTLKEYISQRFRWVSKSRGYRDPAIILVALIVFLFNFSLLTYSFMAGHFDLLPRFIAGMWIIKVIIDLPILLGFSIFARRGNVMGYYFIFAIGYVLFVNVAAIVGNLGSGYSWKKRRIRN